MDMLQFDGSSDAYLWLICIEKHFDVVGTPDSENFPEAVKVLRNRALEWWHWWSQRHLQASWRAFHVALLWHFKPEYRDILPISDEEEELELEIESTMLANLTFNKKKLPKEILISFRQQKRKTRKRCKLQK